MAAKKTPDWLPAGWKVLDKVKNGRKIRCYINLDTGTRVYSKPAVMRLVKSEDASSSRAQQKPLHVRRSTRNKQVEPVTRGASHTSVKEVKHARVKEADHTPVKEAHHTPVKEAHHTLAQDHTPAPDHTPAKDANLIHGKDVNHTPDWLPHEWIMELRTRKSGTLQGNTYKRYLDPSTGNSFYSKVAVMRYIKENQCVSGSSSEQKKSSSAANTVNTSDHSSKSLRSSERKRPLQEKSPEQKSGSSKSSVCASKSQKFDVKQKVPQIQKSDEQKTDPSENTDHHLKGRKSAERKKPLQQKSLKLETDSSKSSVCAPKIQKSDVEQKEPRNEKSNEQQTDTSTSSGHPAKGMHSTERKKPPSPRPHNDKNDSSKIKNSVWASKCQKFDEAQNEPQNEQSDEQKMDPPKSSVWALKSKTFDVDQKELQNEKSNEPKLDPPKSSVCASKSQDSDAEEKGLPDRKPNEQKTDTLKSSFYASRDLESDVEQKEPQNGEPDEQKIDPSKVTIEKVVDEKLPPGWIREIRTCNLPDKVKRDSFYIDPVSGYVFRSRLDVVRYLDTGEISCHAFKRKDDESSVVNMAAEEKSSPHSAKRSKAAKRGTSKQLFEGARNSDSGLSPDLRRERHYGGSSKNSGSELPKVEPKKTKRLGEKNCSNIGSSSLSRQLGGEAQGRNINFTEHMSADECSGAKNSTLSVEKEPEALKDMPNQESLVGGPLKDDQVQKKPECSDDIHTPTISSDKQASIKKSPTGESDSLQAQTPLIVVQGLSSRKNRKVASESSPFSFPPKDMFVEKEVGTSDRKATVKYRDDDDEDEDEDEDEGEDEDEDEEWNCNKRQRNTRKRNPRKRKKELKSPSYRSSKRLAGVKVEPVIKSRPVERVLRASAKKSSAAEQNYQGKTSLVKETTEVGNILPSEDQVAGEPSSKGAWKNKGIDKESDFSFSTAMWTNDDPCLDFAIKTLTGVIPLNDDVAMHEHDYDEHQFHTSSADEINADGILLDAGPPPGFSNNNNGFSTSHSETNPTQLDLGPPPGFSNNNGFSTSQSKTDPIQLDRGPPPGFSKNRGPSTSQSKTDPIQLDMGPPPGFSKNSGPSTSQSKTDPIQLDMGPPPGFSKNNGAFTLSAQNKTDHLSRLDAGLPPGFSQGNQPDHLRGCSLQQRGKTTDHRAHLDPGPPPGFSLSKVSTQSEMSEPKHLDLNLDSGPPPGFSQGKVSSPQTDTMSETKQLKVSPVDFCPRHFTLQEQRRFIDSLFLDSGPPPGFPNKMSSQPDVSGSR